MQREDLPERGLPDKPAGNNRQPVGDDATADLILLRADMLFPQGCCYSSPAQRQIFFFFRIRQL